MCIAATDDECSSQQAERGAQATGLPSSEGTV
jgi:hypothetical protein